VDDASGRSADLQIHLLGPLELLIGGQLVPAGGPRQRALLALLALSVGVAVPASHLIDLLWEDAPPPAAANTVQVYISRLRRLFTADGGVSPLRSVSGAYLLDLPSEAIDAGRFEALSERGRARLASGDPAAAAEDLRTALAVWRGAALPDLAGTAVARAAVARLESMRLAVLADRIDADALLGRHVALIPELAGLVLEYPLDERFVGQLMTAHYRAGRQAEAFAVYLTATDRLADELGIDPGPALRALHTRILRQDADLEPGLDLRLRAESASVGWNLPAGPRIDPAISASLIGRRAELSSTMALIGHPDARLITVLGPGGAGKTRLVAEVAAVLAAGTPPMRVIFVPLAAVFDAAQVLVEICRVLGAEPDWRGEPVMDLAVRALSVEPAVVVLDNLEQLVSGDLSGITELLTRVDQLTILATSRAVAGLPGERLLRLGPLPLPAADADRDPVSVLGAEAVQLFRERARAVLPEFEVTAANAAVVAALCRGLDGLPLALELAAARVRVLPPEEILHRFDRRLELLAGGAAHLPARQRSMWAALDWSARLLDPSELLIFGQLSVFVGGWTLAAAEQVCGSVPLAEPSTVDVLARLAEKSLVVADGTGRLGMLETVRDYAQEVLAADPAVAALTRDRHARYYAGLAEELGPLCRGWLGAPAGFSPREQLDAEAGNLRLALEYAAGDRVAGELVHDELLGRLVVALLDHWFASGRLREADRWLQAARRSDLSAALRARLLLSFGNLAVVGGDLPAAAEALAEAHETALRFGDSLLVVRTFAARAVAARYLGRSDAALALLTQALQTLAREGVPEATGLECALENELGEVLDELDRGPEAVDLWQECRRWAAAMDNPVQLAYPLVNLARNALDSGAGEQARALIEQALTAANASGSAPVRADVLTAAGAIDHRAGRGRQAVTQLRAAIRLGHDCGQLLALPEAVALLGGALVTDQPRVAARLLAAAEAWRAAHSIRAVPRSSRAIVAEAELALAVAVGAGELRIEELEADRRRGVGTPFGSLRGLGLLDPGLRGTTEPVDPREPDVIDLRSVGRVSQPNMR
jgi:predicted ATPase/DNA-binding SARP family transcriptional activator